MAKVDHYRDNYVAVNKHAGSDLLPVFNNLVFVADIRTYEVQQLDFRDRVTVLNTLSENFDIVEDVIDNKVKEFYSLVQFQDRMRLVCSTGFDQGSQRRFLRQLPVKFESYYNVLGPTRIKELSFRNDMLKAEFDKIKNNQDIDVRDQMIKMFLVGNRYSLSEIKTLLSGLYESANYRKTPKAVDLKEVFEVKSCTIYDENKRKTHGLEIIKLKDV